MAHDCGVQPLARRRGPRRATPDRDATLAALHVDAQLRLLQRADDAYIEQEPGGSVDRVTGGAPAQRAGQRQSDDSRLDARLLDYDVLSRGVRGVALVVTGSHNVGI